MHDFEAYKKREAHLEKVMYSAWLRESGETNDSYILHLKNCVAIAIQECLTDKQREYLSLYISGYTIVEIGDLCEVNKSTVSRTIHRAVDNLTSHIKYATPRTLRVGNRVDRYFTKLYVG